MRNLASDRYTTFAFNSLLGPCGKHVGQSGVPVLQIALVRGTMVMTISYVKAVKATNHFFPYKLGRRHAAFTEQVVSLSLIADILGMHSADVSVRHVAQVHGSGNTASTASAAPYVT